MSSADRTAREGIASDSRGTTERILVVDDEPSMRVAIRRFLEQLGYEVEEAVTCAEAERAVRCALFDAAVWTTASRTEPHWTSSPGSLIEVVNRFGSFFYGSILGIFMLAMIPRVRPTAAFIALIVGMGSVATVSFGAPSISFLCHNVIGAVTVVAVGILGSLAPRRGRPAEASESPSVGPS